MNFNDSITLNTYLDNANNQFNEIQSRLSKTESNFQTRMNGKTTAKLVGSFIGSIVWLAVFVICAFLVKDIVNPTLLTITLIIIICLICAMLIDNIMNFSYYNKISSYVESVLQLQNRVKIGKNSIKSNHDAFMSSKNKGWNFILKAAPSIPKEATSIESTMANMESIKNGFINTAKNIFYYATIVMFTITCCVTLFPVGGEIMTGISGESLSSDTLLVLNIIALVLVGICEIILSKVVWSKTDCTVTNVTLFIVAFGPVAFLALIALVTALVMLVILIATAIFYILGTIILIAIGFACLCGG